MNNIKEIATTIMIVETTIVIIEDNTIILVVDNAIKINIVKKIIVYASKAQIHFKYIYMAYGIC